MIYYLFDRWSVWFITYLTGDLYDLLPVRPVISVIYYLFDRWSLWFITYLSGDLYDSLDSLQKNTL